MKKLIECINSQVKILEEKRDQENKVHSLRCEILWQVADLVNLNNRKYSRKVLENAIEKTNKRIDDGQTVWGSAFHPEGNDVKLTDVSHFVEVLWMEKSGECKGIIEIVSTEIGKDAMVLAKVGKIGVSSRGTGTVTPKTEEINGKETSFLEVNEDYELQSIDFALSPSVSVANAKLISEQIEINEMYERYYYQEARLSGYRKSFEEFLNEKKESY